jgi:hypothetical protein
MARLAGTGTGQGVYAFLLEREEQQIARFGRDMVCEDGAVFHWPRHRIDALRAGEPVEVKASMLPLWAREGVECRWWLRAVVHPDDSIRFVEDDGSRWLAENGL